MKLKKLSEFSLTNAEREQCYGLINSGLIQAEKRGNRYFVNPSDMKRHGFKPKDKRYVKNGIITDFAKWMRGEAEKHNYRKIMLNY